MSKLLRANFHRLLKDKLFWTAVVFVAAEAVFLSVIMKINVSYGAEYGLDTVVLSAFGFSGFPLQGIIMAVVCSLFVGKEYAGGTIRNKLMIGRTRESVWLANLITCIAIGLVLVVAYILFALLFGLPMLGGFTLPTQRVVLSLVAGVLMMAAYATVINAVTLLFRSQTAAVVTNLLAVFVMMMVVMIFAAKLSEPLYWETSDGPMRNESYPGPILRAFMRFVIDLVPTGQSYMISTGQLFERTWQPYVYGVGLIALVNAGGVVLFRRLDIK